MDPARRRHNVSYAEPFGPSVTVAVGGAQIKFDTPNELTVYRAQSALRKEPDMIAWLDGFQSTDVFYDVGANVGVFTLYAAKVRGMRVIAFEPESQNFGLLNRNLFINDLAATTRAYCLGLSDRAEITDLSLRRFVTGGALHAVGGDAGSRALPHTQGCVTMTLDAFASSAPWKPTHIKIDVDGLEAAVIRGGAATLRDLQGLVIEIGDRPEDAVAVRAALAEAGLRHSHSGPLCDANGARNEFFRR